MVVSGESLQLWFAGRHLFGIIKFVLFSSALEK